MQGPVQPGWHEQWKKDTDNGRKVFSAIFRVGCFYILTFFGTLFLLGPGYWLVFFGLTHALIWFYPYWPPMGKLIIWFTGINRPIKTIPIEQISLTSWILLVVRITIFLGIAIFGIQLILTHSFCGQSLLC